jgi:hypothetical protein
MVSVCAPCMAIDQRLNGECVCSVYGDRSAAEW